MPATAKDLGVRDSFMAQQNIAGGTAYLDALLMYYHEDIALALAAYNAGPAAVDRYHGIPPYAETRRYVERVIHDFNQRKLREAQRQSNHAPLLSMAAMADAPAK
jgi:soluble lytic murein transglycosylase-like protein